MTIFIALPLLKRAMAEVFGNAVQETIYGTLADSAETKIRSYYERIRRRFFPAVLGIKRLQ